MNCRFRFARTEEMSQIIELMRPYNMHHVPSPEMGELDEKFFIVAEVKGTLVGAAGFTFLSAEIGKTTLMAVSPEYSGCGIGKELQLRRMRFMKSLGCNKIVTNADRPETIAWYKKHFGYKEIGRLKKIHSFGREDISEWTTLESDLACVDYSLPSQKRLVINAALTGMVPRKKDNPNLPVAPSEIIKDALTAEALGASIIHLHARDDKEEPVPDQRIYKEIIEGIREKRPDLILCVTTSGRNYPELSKRAAVLNLDGDAKPDMASLTLGSMNFATQASVNPPEIIKELAKQMLKKGIKPELEVFEPGMIDYAKYLYRKGYLRPPFYFNILLGSLGTMNATRKNLQFMVSTLPSESIWAATGIGSSQGKTQCEAISYGGGVRVGLEDNLYLDENKTKYASNEDLIRRVLEWGKQKGCEIASPNEVREWLEL